MPSPRDFPKPGDGALISFFLRFFTAEASSPRSGGRVQKLLVATTGTAASGKLKLGPAVCFTRPLG